MAVKDFNVEANRQATYVACPNCSNPVEPGEICSSCGMRCEED